MVWSLCFLDILSLVQILFLLFQTYYHILPNPKTKEIKFKPRQCSNLTVVYSSKTSKKFQKLVVFFVPSHYCLKNEIYCIHSLLRSLLTCILLRIQTTKMARLDVLGGYLPSVNSNFIGMSKDMTKRLPQLYYIKMTYMATPIAKKPRS